MGWAANCPPPSPPTLCQWITGHDAVALSRIVALELLESPSVLDESTDPVLVDDCPGSIVPGLKVTIEPLEAPHGTLPERLTFIVGGQKVGDWDPQPYVDGEGFFVWVGSKDAQYLEVGQIVGAALHHSDAHDLWTLLADSLFLVEEDDLVTFQRGAYQCHGAPPGSSGALRWADVRAANCEGDEGAGWQQVADWNIEEDNGSPSAYRAATCLDF